MSGAVSAQAAAADLPFWYLKSFDSQHFAFPKSRCPMFCGAFSRNWRVLKKRGRVLKVVFRVRRTRGRPLLKKREGGFKKAGRLLKNPVNFLRDRHPGKKTPTLRLPFEPISGRGCDEALFGEKKGFSVKRGEGIQ